MKRLFYFFTIALLLSSCSSETPDSFNEEITFELNSIVQSNDSVSIDFSSNNFSYVFEVSNQENIYESKLSVKRTLDNKLLVIDYIINTNEEKWELFQDEQVDKLSMEASSKMDLNSLEFAELSRTFENVFQNVPYNNSIKSKIALLAYHSSVITNIQRVNTGQGCTVHPMYLTGKSFFRCQEDVSYSRESIVAALDIYRSLNGNDEKSSRISSLLATENSDRIPFQKFYSIHFPIDEFKNQIKREKQDVQTIVTNSMTLNYKQLGDFIFAKNTGNLEPTLFVAGCSGCSQGCGSDLGCCGNYSGCCVAWSLICWAHDIECARCDKWHCGWACEPMEEG